MSLYLKSNLRKICDQTKSFFISLFEWLSHTFISGGSLFVGFCRRYKIILCSIIGSLFIFVADWVRDNVPTTYFESLDGLSYLKSFHSTDSLDLDGACFIDISNYHELVEVSFDRSDGDVVVTNRNVLISFLQKIENINYRFLFIDLYFDKLGSDSSSIALANQIKKMKNVLVCRHPEQLKEDTSFHNMSAVNGYYEPRFSAGHTRGLFIKDGKDPTIPIQMYNILNPSDTIPFPKSWWSINLLGDSVYIPKNIGFRNSLITYVPYLGDMQNPEWGFRDIVMDTLKYLPKIEGNIVIVGDMYSGDDMHATYAGKIPGPVLTYFQYLSLMDRDRITYFKLALLLLYILMIWGRIHISKNSDKIDNFVKNQIKGKKIISFFGSSIWVFITSFIGYSLVFGAISWFMMDFFSFAYSTFVPALSFSMLEWGLESREKYLDLFDN